MTQPPNDYPYGQPGSYPADPSPQPAYQGRPPDWREQGPLVDPLVLEDLPPVLAEEAALRQLAVAAMLKQDEPANDGEGQED
jgi:hypothetical protein